MNWVLSPPGDELCPDERFERNHAEFPADSQVGDFRGRKNVIRSNFPAREDQVNRVSFL